MLNQRLITIGKLKLAFKLSQRDVDDLFDELLPDAPIAYALYYWMGVKSSLKSERFYMDTP